MIHRQEYPLAFGFDEAVTIGSHEKAQVLRIVQNILVSYGVNKLHPILQDVVQNALAGLLLPSKDTHCVDEEEGQSSIDRCQKPIPLTSNKDEMLPTCEGVGL